MEVHRQLLQAAALRRLGDTSGARHKVVYAANIMETTGMTMTSSMLPADDLRAMAGIMKDINPDFLCPIPTIPAATSTPELTPREVIVLRALASHGPTASVARHLGVSINTIKSQVRSIHRKLEASTRDEALSRARAHGLLED